MDHRPPGWHFELYPRPAVLCRLYCLRNRRRTGGRTYLRTFKENIYSAIKGQGAFKNGKRIHVSRSNTLNTSLVATGFPFRIKDVIDAYLKVFKELFMHATGIRRGGSACLDLAYTAEGIFGGFFECSLSPWDVAAGALLVKEAGGVVTDFDGGNQYLKTGNIIAGSKGVHREMLKIIEGNL